MPLSRATIEKEVEHGVLDLGISAEMTARFQALVNSEWEAEGLWDSEFRSQLTRPLSASTYIDNSLRVWSLRFGFSMASAPNNFFLFCVWVVS